MPPRGHTDSEERYGRKRAGLDGWPHAQNLKARAALGSGLPEAGSAPREEAESPRPHAFGVLLLLQGRQPPSVSESLGLSWTLIRCQAWAVEGSWGVAAAPAGAARGSAVSSGPQGAGQCC